MPPVRGPFSLARPAVRRARSGRAAFRRVDNGHEMGDRVAGRGHELLPHTADAGLRARALDLPSLFEEAAAALGELAADVDPGAPADEIPVELTAGDLAGLAFAWLNELIGLADARAAAVAGARVEAVVDRPCSAPVEPGERAVGLRATVALVPCDRGARPRLDVKSATYHRLAVERAPGGGWTLTAYLDV